MPAPVVSCLVTSYNLGHLVGRALDSALAQDYGAEHLEIIVVDDGSTDDTAAVVARYRDRVRYVYKDNGGTESSVNRGIAEATGTYLALLDADDEWPPDKVSRQVAILEARPEVGLVYSDMEIIDGAGIVTAPSYFAMLRLTPPRGRIFGAQLVRNYPAGGTSMWRAALNPLFHPLDERQTSHDWTIATSIARAHEIEYVDAPLYRYRSHGGNQNLGTTGEQRRRLDARENVIRRRWLRDVRPEEATDAELAEAAELLVRIDAAGERAPEDLPADPTQRAAAEVALHEGVAAHRAGDGHLALTRLVNAAALDPDNASARATLQALLGAVRAASQTALRTFVAVAHLDELRLEPGLLRAYADVHGPRDDATLIVYGAGWEGQAAIAALDAIRQAAGVPPQTGPHVVLGHGAPDPAGEAALAARAQAILTERPQTGPWASLPPFSRATMPQLRQASARAAAG